MGRQLTNLWKERIRKVPFLGVSVVLCHLFAVPLIYAIPVRWIMRDSVVKAYGAIFSFSWSLSPRGDLMLWILTRTDSLLGSWTSWVLPWGLLLRNNAAAALVVMLVFAGVTFVRARCRGKSIASVYYSLGALYFLFYIAVALAMGFSSNLVIQWP